MGVSRLIYEVGIRLYKTAIQVAALRNEKARQWLKGRKDQPIPQFGDAPVIWFHAASLGEFEQGRPVMEAFKNLHPEAKLVVTFFSPSGYQQRKDYAGADAVCYLPLDTKQNAEKWVTTLRPIVAVFIKYEVWPNLIEACKKNRCNTLLMAARFHKRQPYFQWWGNHLKGALQSLDHIIVQEREPSTSLLQSIGVKHFSYAPDTRVDRVVAVRDEEWHHPLLDQLPKQKVIVAGSIWKKDLEHLLPAIKRFEDYTWILAPHDISTQNLLQLQEMIPMQGHMLSADKEWQHRIIWVDTMGMLARLYRYGTAAYVGGGFGAGIHNILEPTVYGLPVAFGPNHETFHEATTLLQKGAATLIQQSDDVTTWIHTLADQQKYQNAVESAKDYIKENKGGTLSTLKVLQSLWNPK